MPNAKHIGALINPYGDQGDAIDEEEYQQLKACLQVLRSRPSVGRSALEFIIDNQLRNGEVARAGAILYEIQSELDQIKADSYPSEVNGLLSHGRDFEPLFEKEFDDLRNFLTTIRRGGWFADFMASFAVSGSEEIPAEITPMVVMRAITVHLAEFEQKAVAAREMLASYPETMRAMLPPDPAESLQNLSEALTEASKPKAAKRGKPAVQPKS